MIELAQHVDQDEDQDDEHDHQDRDADGAFGGHTDTVEPSKQINLRVPHDLLERIERARGDIPRERYLRRLIEESLPTDT